MITKNVLSNDMEMVEHAYKIVHEEKVAYLGARFKKYICLALGIFVGLLLSYPAVNTVSLLSNSLYNRSGLEE